MEEGVQKPEPKRTGWQKRKLWNWARIKKVFKDSDYSLPIQAWDATTHVLLSIFTASFAINLLSLAFPLALLQVYDRVVPNDAMSTLTLLIVGVGCALLLEACFRIARSYVGAWADSKFEHVTGCQAFKSMVESSLLEYEKEGSGIHLKRMNALGMLREYYAGQALISAADIPFVLLILLIIYYIAHWIVLIPIVVVVLYLFVTFYEAHKLQTVLTQRFKHDERRFNFIIETLSNIHTVKSVTMEAQMQRRYERLQKVSAVHDYELNMKGSVSTIASISVSQIMIILVVACGSMLIINGQLTIGGLAACTLLSGRCLQPISLIVGLWTRLQTIKLANDEIKTILAMKPESKGILPTMPKCRGDITLEKISFRYSDDDPFLFNEVDLLIKAKETVAITGEGLKGKSTLVWLLLGMFRPTSGRVLIDDQDIANFQAESVRKKIAYLPQKAIIFQGTIMENLTMFKEQELFDYAKKVCGILGIADVIEHLPKGYETIIGDQTIDTLSRGITQRIAIARALIQDPRIIIFDEANTAMDMHSDNILRGVLEQLKGQRTLILISHRPSILKLADKVLTLENGKFREKDADK
jgi:ATP-binding cassette subfamily C protein LapB